MYSSFSRVCVHVVVVDWGVEVPVRGSSGAAAKSAVFTTAFRPAFQQVCSPIRKAPWNVAERNYFVRQPRRKSRATNLLARLRSVSQLIGGEDPTFARIPLTGPANAVFFFAQAALRSIAAKFPEVKFVKIRSQQAVEKWPEANLPTLFM